MKKEYLQSLLSRFCRESRTNYLQPPVSPEEAEQLKREDTANFAKNNYFGGGEYDPAIYNKDKEEKYIGLRFFGEPVVAAGAAEDPAFRLLRQEGVVGPHHKLPTDWLPEAKSVVSIFLPYSDRVLQSNIQDPALPSLEWMFTRVDGQNHLLATGLAAAEALRAEGWQAVVPQTDSRFQLQTAVRVMGEGTPLFTSNWSERHVAYAAGMGTFGLHTCLITRAGCAGRLISLVTDCPLTPDQKDYTGYLDYCSRCGACLRRCPAGAIGEGCTKDKPACGAYVGRVSAPHSPRYGCGKCQCGIPCQRRAMGIRA